MIEPPISAVKNIAAALDVPMAYLLGTADNPNNRPKTHWMEAVTEEKAPSLHIGDVFFNGAVRVIRSDVEGKHAHIALEEDEKKMPADELIALVSAFEKISNQGRLSIEGLALLADAAAKAIASSTTAPESTPVPPEGKDTAPPPDAPRRPREGR